LRPEWLTPVIVDGHTIGAMLIVPEQGLGRSRRIIGRIAEQSSEADPKRNAFAIIEGRSAALRATIERARQLVSKRVTVLIEGESGVGKELFARALHGEERSNTPFIAFNCAATSKELLGDELFGHVRGAFTGATSEGRAGRFELADGGTLCLDEIGDMPLALQPILLRALEEGVIYRLGDSQPRHVNVRLLALTNRNLLEEVDAGHFRRDLYHRISVTRLRIPPLRERIDDIELLADRFNRKLAQYHGVQEKHFGAEVTALLKTYSWPGNVRELRNVIESLVLTCSTAEVAIADLPAEVSGLSPGAVPTGSEAASLDDFEHLAVKRALESSRGNLTLAARALGISRSTLYRKVERYHLEALSKRSDEQEPTKSSRP
jgi:transcriptional regulator with PAS, ATPase and Fis domain